MTTATPKKPRRKKVVGSLPPAPRVWEQYADAVLAGIRPAGKLQRLAVERHRRDLADGHERGLWFDEEAAQHAVDFFPSFLVHSKGEWSGTPFEPSDWQQFIVANLFGWKRKDGTRRYRQAYIEVPRKNGKSTLIAGIGLYLLIADGEGGADVYSAATTIDQARIIHGEAVNMVKKSPMLRGHVGVAVDNLHVERTNSKFEPLSADAETKDGLNVHAALIDEYHAHPTDAMYEVLNTATGARRQPLIIAITTAGTNKVKSPCGQQNEYGQRVLLGTVEDDETFVFIATIDEGDDWRDEAVWAKANPNLGISCKVDDLRRKARVAAHIPAKQNSFRRLHLDEWTEQTTRWLDLAKWDACAGDISARDLPELLSGRRCFGGLDLASTGDTTALVLYFPPTEDDKQAYLLPRFFMPANNMTERDKKDRTTYSAWAAEEWLDTTEGNTTDYAFVRQAVQEAAEEYELVQVAYDRWNSSQLVSELVADGIDMVPFGQGFASMNAPTKSLEARIIDQSIVHGGHPVLRWQAQNVSVKEDPAGNMKPDKARSPEKIDGMVAAIMAIGIAELSPADASSHYEKNDLRELD